MNEKLTFFEALERVVGTNKRMRYQGKDLDETAEWSLYGISEEYMPYLETKDGCNAWWPDMETQKEKAWEVKPKERV